MVYNYMYLALFQWCPWCCGPVSCTTTCSRRSTWRWSRYWWGWTTHSKSGLGSGAVSIDTVIKSVPLKYILFGSSLGLYSIIFSYVIFVNYVSSCILSVPTGTKAWKMMCSCLFLCEYWYLLQCECMYLMSVFSVSLCRNFLVFIMTFVIEI